MSPSYYVPTALTILAGIFLGIGGICALVIIVDITLRRGWKSMMLIMIPVWPINATYMGPLTLFLYFKYGRPSKPEPRDGSDQHDHSTMGHDHSQMHHRHLSGVNYDSSYTTGANRDAEDASTPIDVEKRNNMDDMGEHQMQPGGHAGHHKDGGRPTWATVMIGVSHCGAGCVLGDIVGEWLVYGTGAEINGASIWVELLVDYGFALLFGIFFQYYSIAPMSGEYGPKTLLKAAKADIASLTSFELGLFSWMVAYQVGIWNYRLAMNTATYWWMMQVGMFLGFWTAFPVNWWLISKNIKEPCA